MSFRPGLGAVRWRADAIRVGSLVRLAAIISSALIVIGFAFFATDEMGRGSSTQQEVLGAPVSDRVYPNAIAPSPSEERVREDQHSSFRELVDDANDVLLRHFAGIVDSEDTWVTHVAPAGFGLLVYGLGLGIVANALPKQRTKKTGAEWRTVSPKV